uniref:Fibronectin type-III domain-containing protein n=1 Tax=Timema cristinae TaxID=61476 RepID=A0A7R9CFV8_TIMCR|nr:unnamed protein product [Timema cristinae]
MQLTDNVVAKSGIIEPISRLYINSTTSLITAQWTASNSSSECIEGYEVCWNRSSLIFTNTTCSNVSASTSHSYSEQHENCIDYTATITTLGVNGSRSNPRFTSISISPLNVNASYINMTKTVTESSIVFAWQTSLEYPFCSISIDVCLLSTSSINSICMRAVSGELAIHLLKACALSQAIINTTISSLLIKTTTSHVEPIYTKSANSTMIQSVNVVNVTGRNVVLSWEPVYDESPCASYYSVCHLEHNSRGEPNCLAVDKTRNNITLQLLKSYTRYNVNVSAVFPDLTQSDVVVTNFRTAGKFHLNRDLNPGHSALHEDFSTDQDMRKLLIS